MIILIVLKSAFRVRRDLETIDQGLVLGMSLFDVFPYQWTVGIISVVPNKSIECKIMNIFLLVGLNMCKR